MFQDILTFWFDEVGKSGWWGKSPELDATIAQRFAVLHEAANNAELFDWRTTAQGRLAEIIILDQFSRNMFRNSPAAFASDAIALVLSQEAVAVGADQQLEPQQRSFLYMPYMHSESLKIHEVAVQLFSQDGMENNLNFEMRHKAIIERFGRYPHRNAILGRESTNEELAFLKQPGSSF